MTFELWIRFLKDDKRTGTPHWISNTYKIIYVVYARIDADYTYFHAIFFIHMCICVFSHCFSFSFFFFFKFQKNNNMHNSCKEHAQQPSTTLHMEFFSFIHLSLICHRIHSILLRIWNISNLQLLISTLCSIFIFVLELWDTLFFLSRQIVFTTQFVNEAWQKHVDVVECSENALCLLNGKLKCDIVSDIPLMARTRTISQPRRLSTISWAFL